MKEALKKEALRRMKALKLFDNGYDSPVGDFKLNCKPWKSEFYGILYYLDDFEKNLVKEFEKKYAKYGIKVYHCYKGHQEFGEILYMFFVSEEQEDSPSAFDNMLKEGIAYIYAYNISEPSFSEFGTCYVKSQYGGIVVS